jgi:hypothetical protein
MNRSSRAVRTLVALLALFLLAAGAGCGTSPTAPAVASGGLVTTATGGPSLLRVAPDGTASWVEIPAALQAGSPDQLIDSPDVAPYDDANYDPRRALAVTQRVDGLVGGRLVCGRYVLSIPPGAFAGVGMVSMALPDSTLMLCNLTIAPAELNAFQLPVSLEIHTSETTADTDSLEIYWWDPGNSRWTAMGCQKSNSLQKALKDELLTSDPAVGAYVPLSHFSTYASGKAGW